MAAVASVLLHRYNPMLITFGQPPTFDAGCPLIPTTKYYRYVNSIMDRDYDALSFDGVAFAPNWVSGAIHYGYFLLVGDDPAALKYLGYDQEYTFDVQSYFDYSVIAAHSMYGNSYSYEARVENLLNNFPISIGGFGGGVLCEEVYKELCESGMCNVEEGEYTGLCTDPPTQSPSSSPSLAPSAVDDSSSSSTTNPTTVTSKGIKTRYFTIPCLVVLLVVTVL